MDNSILTAIFGRVVEKMVSIIMTGYHKNHIPNVNPELVREWCQELLTCDYDSCGGRTIFLCNTVTRDTAFTTLVASMGGIAVRLPIASGEWVTLPIVDIRVVSKLTSKEKLALASRLAFATNRLAENTVSGDDLHLDVAKSLKRAQKVFPRTIFTELNADIDKDFVEKYPEHREALRQALTIITPIVEQQNINLMLKGMECDTYIKGAIESIYTNINREYRARMKALS